MENNSVLPDLPDSEDNTNKSEDNSILVNEFKEFNEFYMDNNESQNSSDVKLKINNEVMNVKAKRHKKKRPEYLLPKNKSDKKKLYDTFASSISSLNTGLITLRNEVREIKTPMKSTSDADNAMTKLNMQNVNNSVPDNNKVISDADKMAADFSNVINENMDTDTTDMTAENAIINDSINNTAGPSGVNTRQPNWITIPVNNKKRIRKVRINKNDANDNRFMLLTIDDDDEHTYSDEEEFNFPMLKREKLNVGTKHNNNGSINKNNTENIITKTIENINNNVSKSKGNIANLVGESSGTNKNNVSTPVPNREKKIRVPPIICYDLKVKELRLSLENFDTLKYRISCGASSRRCTINASDTYTYNNILTMLKASNVNYFTYTPKSEQGLKLIIKNVPIDYGVDDLVSEFKVLNLFDNIEKLVLLERGSSARFHYFLIKLKPGVKAPPYTDTKVLFNCKVYIEKFNPTDLVQCFNCQRPGHVSVNCRMDSRCVKCGLTHAKDSCAINSESPRNLLKCVLCKKNGHTSNFRGCSYLQKILEEKVKNKISANKSRSNFVERSLNNMVNPRVSFAGAVRGNTGKGIDLRNDASFPAINRNSTNSNNRSNQVPQTSTGMSIVNMQNILESAAEECFGCNFSTLRENFDRFMITYNSSEDKQVKRNALFNFMLGTNYA